MIGYWIISGSFFCLLAVILGAFGAHGLKDILDNYGKEIFQKAVFYHFIHAISLILLGVLENQISNINLSVSGYSFIFGIISQIGDLFESFIKRKVGVKDSGTILQGHGGMLDRMDSLMFVAPVFYIYLKFYVGILI